MGREREPRGELLIVAAFSRHAEALTWAQETLEQDLLDELCVTIAPVLVGGAANRIATGAGQVHTRMRRGHLLTDDAGYLYARYVRGR